jgi:DNA-directed RNA polymerase subunit RPC12/RpoP
MDVAVIAGLVGGGLALLVGVAVATRPVVAAGHTDRARRGAASITTPAATCVLCRQPVWDAGEVVEVDEETARSSPAGRLAGKPPWLGHVVCARAAGAEVAGQAAAEREPELRPGEVACPSCGFRFRAPERRGAGEDAAVVYVRCPRCALFWDGEAGA